MSKLSYTVAVTKILDVQFDSDKIDDEFWKQFNETISDRGGPDMDYLAEHVGWNFVQGYDDFIEGVGDLKEMKVVIRELDASVDTERAAA